MRVIAIANHKGGVGKTTTTLNLGGALADAGQRVLLVDLDPQRSTTLGYGIAPEACPQTMYHVLVAAVPVAAVARPVTPRLAVAPANADLTDAIVQLWDAPARDLRLRNSLDELDAAYDLVLVDCPPSLNLFTLNALMAAREVIIPVQPQFFSMAVLGELLDLIGNVRQHANRRLTIAGFLVNQVKARTGYHRQVVEHLRSELAHSRVYETTIPDSIRVQEAAQARLPVIRFDPDCPAAVAYRQLAREVLAHAG